ncbi:MAG: hypothetical protein ABDI20_03040, partial [Candidatus Bipolaricaulaceae bacterium]
SPPINVEVVQPLQVTVERVEEVWVGLIRKKRAYWITFTITDPNRTPTDPPSYHILAAVKTRSGRGKVEIESRLGGHAPASLDYSRVAVSMWGNTARVFVLFTPPEGLTEKVMEEVTLSASLARCGVVTTYNGVPIELCPDVLGVEVSPSEARVEPGQTVRATVTSRFPCPARLERISGPGEFGTLYGQGVLSGTYVWTVPSVVCLRAKLGDRHLHGRR